MKKLDSKGFGALELVLILLVVIVLGGVGYYVYRNHSKKTQTVSTQAATTTPSQDFEVDSWGIMIPLTGNLVGVKAGTVNDSGYSATDQSVDVVAPALDSTWTCEASAGVKGIIGSVSRTTKDKRSGPGEPLVSKKVGTYTYGYEAGGANCTTDPLYQQMVDAFKAAFSSIHAH